MYKYYPLNVTLVALNIPGSISLKTSRITSPFTCLGQYQNFLIRSEINTPKKHNSLIYRYTQKPLYIKSRLPVQWRDIVIKKKTNSITFLIVFLERSLAGIIFFFHKFNIKHNTPKRTKDSVVFTPTGTWFPWNHHKYRACIYF